MCFKVVLMFMFYYYDMASKTYTQHTVDGRSHLARRSTPQGRHGSGLGKPVLVRLYEEDLALLSQMEKALGQLFNLNQIIRDAVASKRSVYTELLKH
jgi:hypothetical protein